MSKPDKVLMKIQEVAERRRIVGMACAFLIRGRVVWKGNVGQADIERKLPVTDKTIFRIASIAKTVTAVALLQLVEQGRCSLDDDVGRLLGLPLRHPLHREESIRLRHLMTHTSGLRDEYKGFAAASRQEPMLPLSELLMPGGGWQPTKLWGDKPPGDPAGYEYSNLGAIVMATIVERLSGERFDRYCRKHLLLPLGMTDSSFNLDDIDDPNRLAVLYERDSATGQYIAAADAGRGVRPDQPDLREYVPGVNGSLFEPQGGLRTTITDLSRWLELLAGRGERNGVRLLQARTVQDMLSQHWTREPQEGFYRESGLQLQRTRDLFPGRLMVGQAGDAYGLRSGMYFEPDTGMGLVYAMNGLDDAKDGHVFTAAETELAAAMTEIFLKKK
ncbi:serine hydrolase domain-containing protein [Paenibacillus herberti]|uniref:Beta-lactamase-related domain-containing protein n=1 Tax=Paenibacillus herberti TaxID=1619309 RepID=A0A229NVE1_9BACL|nr:serine hydrolase domain-containing protein [Paenibacillus herberti]OXM13876.1 hypothetical protein CGZ75_12740 [Paenibacillus herberti]